MAQDPFVAVGTHCHQREEGKKHATRDAKGSNTTKARKSEEEKGKEKRKTGEAEISPHL